MRIDLWDQGVAGREGLRRYLGLRLMSALDDLVLQVDAVSASLADATSPEGGKRCRMLAVLRTRAVRVEEGGADEYSAIDRAARRLRTGVAQAAARAGAAEAAARERGGRRAGTGEALPIDVASRGYGLAHELRAYAERRLRFALRRFAARVHSVWVRMDDVNGPRGGVDKRCRVTARLRPSGHVHIEELDRQPWAAIDLAAGRTGRVVARALRRHQAQRAPRPARLDRRAAATGRRWKASRG
jgi:ribosome-associated translation inhibitor RaiA